MNHNRDYDLLDFVVKSESLSLLFNNGVHHLYINHEQVRTSELVLFIACASYILGGKVLKRSVLKFGGSSVVILQR